MGDSSTVSTSSYALLSSEASDENAAIEGRGGRTGRFCGSSPSSCKDDSEDFLSRSIEACVNAMDCSETNSTISPSGERLLTSPDALSKLTIQIESMAEVLRSVLSLRMGEVDLYHQHNCIDQSNDKTEDSNHSRHENLILY